MWIQLSFTNILLILRRAVVAQLDRVLDYESSGRRFESSRPHHFLSIKHIRRGAKTIGEAIDGAVAK